MEPFTCARCGQLRERDVIAARTASGDREYVCIDCLSPDEMLLVGDAMDEIACVSNGLWTVEEIARGDHRDAEVRRVALERRIAEDPAARAWAQPILDRVRRELGGEADRAFLE